MTSQEVIDLLCVRRYAAPEWFVLEQVTPGKLTNRFIDLVAWNIWTSRGFPIDGVEVKVARSDWLRELKMPAKAEAACKFVEAYWIAAPEGVVELAEVPAPWGFYEIVGTKIYDRKQPLRTKRTTFDVSELAAILQRVLGSWKSPDAVEALKEQHLADRRRLQADLAEELREAKTDALRDSSLLASLRGMLGQSYGTDDTETRRRARALRWILDSAEDDQLSQARLSIERAAQEARKTAGELTKMAESLQKIRAPAEAKEEA